VIQAPAGSWQKAVLAAAYLAEGKSTTIKIHEIVIYDA
jgi:hypothetical protein